MALTATITVNPASTTINEAVNASITVSNSGGAAVNIIYCQPKARMTGSTALGEVNTGVAVSQPVPLISQPISVPASGTLVLPATFIFFAPSISLGGVQTTYDCFATIQTSDGSVFNTTSPATATIMPLPQPAQEL